MRVLVMDLMHSTPKKTLLKIEQADSFFVAKLKKNQKGLLAFAKEIEACLRGDIPERISTGWRQDLVCGLFEPI